MKTANIILRVSPEQKQTWKGYAQLAGISVGELIRDSVDKAINQVMCEDEIQKPEQHQF